MQTFPLSAVRLSDGAFRDAQQTDLACLLALRPDRLLAPYRREAGLPPVAESYGNWESSGLDGHIAGHALSAAVLLHAATGDARAEAFADELVAGMGECQDALGTGYLGGVPGGVEVWERVRQGDVSGGSFGLNGAWVPWYNLHKTVAGLIDAAHLAHPSTARRALEIAVRFADWWLELAAEIDDAAFQQMLRTEFGGMCESFADLAALCDRPDYLDMARRFADRSVLDPLLAGRDELDGLHANTQIAKVVGYQRLAEVSGDQAWARAARCFWDTVVGRRTLAFGGNSVREHFHPAGDFSGAVTDREGPETCNTANMLELTRRLVLASPDPGLLDYYERATVNHILSAQHPDGGFVYFTPARPGHYRVYSQPDEGFWCCVGTGLESHARYGEIIFTHDDDALRVNLLIPARLDWGARGVVAELRTTFPDLGREDTAELHLEMTEPQTFAIHVRRPSWITPGADLGVAVNGVPVQGVLDHAGVRVRREWRDGDVLSWRLVAHPWVDRLPDGSDWVALRHGPLVLAARAGAEDLVGLVADDSRMGHIASGPLRPLADASVLVADTDDELARALRPHAERPLTFVLEGVSRYAVELEPLHRLHDTRYTMYFPVAGTEQGAAARRRAELAAVDEEQLALAERTVDHVACGQQQPESDHGFEGVDTWTGAQDGVHWRAARGSFGYDLIDPDGQAAFLAVAHRGGAEPTSCTITVEGVVVGRIDLPAEDAAAWGTAQLVLPDAARQARRDGRYRVRVIAPDGSATPHLTALHLL
ncbi:beta-L-arabinofuranosidase domain-containing protein, partial [Actinotalea sp. C106]|uniref:beta-L-arabinofuranosidase domain-containing protein n=1 Tax=Actinotalea sp. C106 TaxID=2908644 RepID=UPI0020276D3D